MFSFKDKDGHLKTKKIFVVSAIIIIVVCVAYFVVMYLFVPVGMEKRGQFGDMFGFIEALFSGLAFAGLIVIMLQQREDLQNQKDVIQLQRKDLEAQTETLRLQKEEIRHTNKELELQRKEMSDQNRTIILQRFETTLYNMLDFQMRIFNQVRYEDVYNGVIKTGNDAIDLIFTEFETRFMTNSIDFDKCLSIKALDHCHRHLTQILIQIDKAEFLSIKEKNDYVKQLLANLSSEELVLYFYYCLSSFGRCEAKALVEKYALFRDFGCNTVFSPEHLDYFESGAYNVEKS